MPPPFAKEDGQRMDATVIFTPGPQDVPGPTDVSALRDELQRAFDKMQPAQTGGSEESAAGGESGGLKDNAHEGNGNGNGAHAGNGNGKHGANGNGKHSGNGSGVSPNGNGKHAGNGVAQSAQEAKAEADAEKIVDLRQIDIETARTRMRLAGLFDHPELAERARVVDEALALTSDEDVDSGLEGVSYAVSVLGGVIAHRTAVNHVVEHLLASDSPERMVEGDMVRVLKVGSGGMGSVSATYSTGKGLHMWKQLSSTTNPDAIARFQTEAKIMRALAGVGVPAFTHMTDTGFGYELKPRRSLAMLNETSATMSAAHPTVSYLAGGLRPRSEPQVDACANDEEKDALQSTYPRSFVNRLGAEIAKRFSHFHNKGVLHRDLKPGNVMIADDGEVEIIDFGLGNADDLTRHTKSGEVFGTPNYMAPEQFRGAKNATGTSDVWALGVMMYEMHAGFLPFPGSNPVQIIAAITSSTPDFSRIRNNEDRTIIMRMLNKNHDLRPSMREVAQHCFNATTDLKRKFGEDFSAYMKNPTSTHRLDMPTQKRSGLPDYVGASLASSGRFDFSGFDSLADGPLDSGIDSERVLDTIRTKYRDDPAIDESHFPQLQNAPWYKRAGPLSAAAAAAVLATVAAVYSTGAFSSKPSAHAANKAAAAANDDEGKADASIAQDGAVSTIHRQAVVPDTRPGAKYAITNRLDAQRTGAIEWDRGSIEMANGSIVRLNLKTPGTQGASAQVSIPFDNFHKSSSHDDVTLALSVVPGDDWRRVARDTFGNPAFSHNWSSAIFTAVSRNGFHFVNIIEIGGVVIDEASGDVRHVDGAGLAADATLASHFQDLNGLKFDSVRRLNGEPYPQHDMYNADRSTAIWEQLFKSGIIRVATR